MDGSYQLFVLPQVPAAGEEDHGFDPLAALDYLRELRCRECGGELWESAEAMQDYLTLTRDSGVPQTPFDVCGGVDQVHSRRGACVACARLLGLG